jgi:lysophospholipase L1-like esterase
VSGKGGSGYSTVGTDGTTFVSETRRLVTASTQVVVLFGSVNDVHASVRVLAGQVTAAVDAVRTVSTSAGILLVGPSWTRNGPVDSRVIDVSKTVHDVAAVENVQFVDPIGQNWFAGRTDVVGGDGVHPTDAGHEVIAARLCPVVTLAIARIGP